MKIKYSHPNRVLFQDLETGDVFEECGDLFISTDKVDTQIGGTLCVRLSDGYTCTFGDATKVKLVNAKIVIE